MSVVQAPQQILLFDHIVGDREQGRRHREAQCLPNSASPCMNPESWAFPSGSLSAKLSRTPMRRTPPGF
jgi:hypothetical protein